MKYVVAMLAVNVFGDGLQKDHPYQPTVRNMSKLNTIFAALSLKRMHQNPRDYIGSRTEIIQGPYRDSIGFIQGLQKPKNPQAFDAVMPDSGACAAALLLAVGAFLQGHAGTGLQRMLGGSG